MAGWFSALKPDKADLSFEAQQEIFRRCRDGPIGKLGKMLDIERDDQTGFRPLGDGSARVAFVANITHVRLMASRTSDSKVPHSLTAHSVAMTTAAERRTAADLSALLRRKSQARLHVTVETDSGESVDLSPSLVSVLEAAAEMVATGAEVTVLARNEELTSQQAADFLNVSRQYMVRLLDRGDIASTKAGTHRRVRAEDVANYRRHRDEGRAAALVAMADQAQAAGGYDEPPAFGPPRHA
jgi:excisionase family DNA binding protein